MSRPISVTRSRRVPFFDYPALFAEHERAYLEIFREVLHRGAYIMQRDLVEFEVNLANYCGVKFAFGVADGTSALIIALKLADIGDGDEVIVPSHTFVATAAAVHHAGGIPVLCDCGPDHMMDVESARRLVNSRTRAVMPVQLNGRTCDMDEVGIFAKEYRLKIVEDSCQALGAKFSGKHAGTFGVAGTFSFYPAKTLGCFGDGGAVIVNDDKSAEIVRQLRDHGRGTDGKVHRFGHNARLDNIQAAILNFKLQRHEGYVARRRKLADIYCCRLREIDSILLPPAPGSEEKRFDVFQNFEIEAYERERLREHLANRGIGTILQWGGSMIHQFDDLKLKSFAPYAEEMSSRYLMLPMHHLLSDDDVHYICDEIEKFYGNS